MILEKAVKAEKDSADILRIIALISAAAGAAIDSFTALWRGGMLLSSDSARISSLPDSPS